MALLTANVYEMRGRAHIPHVPPMPLWVLIIRIFQWALCTTVFCLTTTAKSVFDHTYPGFGMSFFVFAWTSIFLGHAFCLAFHPNYYNMWTLLILETLTVIFWLVTWAVLVSEISTWSDLENVSYTHFGYTYPVDNYLPVNWKSAINCAKASAGLSALEWVLFIITFFNFGLSLFRLRATEGAEGATVTPAAGPMAEEDKINMVTMPQPVVQGLQHGGQEVA